jgi:hypothetical protein
MFKNIWLKMDSVVLQAKKTPYNVLVARGKAPSPALLCSLAENLIGVHRALGHPFRVVVSHQSPSVRREIDPLYLWH